MRNEHPAACTRGVTVSVLMASASKADTKAAPTPKTHQRYARRTALLCGEILGSTFMEYTSILPRIVGCSAKSEGELHSCYRRLLHKGTICSRFAACSQLHLTSTELLSN